MNIPQDAPKSEIKFGFSIDDDDSNSYKQLIDILPNAIFVSMDGKVVFMNKAGFKLWGVIDEDCIIGHDFSVLFHPDIRDDVKSLEKNILAENVVSPLMEEKIRRFDGLAVHVDIFATPFTMANKKAMLVIVHDLSKIRSIEQNLLEKEMRYRTITETMQDSIWVLDAETMKYVYVSQSIFRLLGYTAEEMYEKPFINFKDPKQLVQIQKFAKEKAKDFLEGRLTNEDFFKFELSYIHKSGKEIFVEMTVHFSKNPITGRIEIHGCTKNISENVLARQALEARGEELKQKNEELRLINLKLKEAKEKAEESDKLKSAFLANMSHEIRTPLNAIIGFADLLYCLNHFETCPHKSSTEKYSSIIKQRGNDLLHIINDILDISKIQANQLVIKDSENDVNELLDDVYCFFSTQKSYIDRKDVINLFISRKIQEEEGHALFDFARMKQILINLISNSLKFTQKGTIELGSYVEGNNLYFFVKDTGIGIPKDKQAIIFEPFRQVNDSSTIHMNTGTGLGLSICRGIISKMNGTFTLESEENKGSTFSLSIPYKPVFKLKETEKISDSNSFEWPEKNILIVEDDKYCMEYLLEILSKTKVSYKLTKSIKEAKDYIYSNQHIDLLLLDIRLPDGNGNDLAKILKKDYPKIPIIAQTANAMENDMETSLRFGCDNYIAKPINKEKLLKMMDKYLC